MSPASEFEARVLVDKLKEVRKVIGETEDLIEDKSRYFPEHTVLLTIPGVGPFISSVVLATIGDPNRFENRKQVIKLAGYDLNAKRSGKTSDSARPVISKRGNSPLRYALYQAAMVASTRNDIFIRYFTNMLHGRELEKGIKTKMRVKLAVKMLVIAWTLMKSKTPFNPYYVGKVLSLSK